jgi:guanyl-specific ribonuclease Sa
MQKRLIARLLLIAALLAAVWLVKRWQNSQAAETVAPPPTKETRKTPRPAKGQIPAYVLEVLAHIRQYGEAPKGYVGGREFQNREKRLPVNDESGKKIRYSEWDVRPKERGQNRGPERLVIGSDRSAYFTSDHYKTFQKIE